MVRILSGAELRAECESEDAALASRMLAGTARWGHWHYQVDSDSGVLLYRNDAGREWYEVDLARCDSGKELLDWILQLEEKNWVTSADLGDFVRAVADLLPVRGWPHESTKRQPVVRQIQALLVMAKP